MATLRQFSLEIARLLQNRVTWLAVLLTACSPIAGLTIYRPLVSNSENSYVSTMQGMYLANPALAGGVLGAIVFALLTIWSIDRFRRSGMETLAHVVVSPMTAALTQTGALLCVSALAQVFTMLLWLPYTVFKLGAVFDAESYLLMYLTFMYGAMPLAILFASAAYQFTRRADLSFIFFVAFAALSLTIWKEQWQLCWLNPCVWAVSDDFSNYRILRSVAYMRGSWAVALAGLWAMSYLCVRRYGKGIAGSLWANIRRVYRPILAVVLLICAGSLYMNQPFVDHSAAEIDYDFLFASEYLESVTCSSRYVDVRPNPQAGSVYGSAEFQLQNTSGEKQNIRFLIDPGYKVASVKANGIDVPFAQEDYQTMNEKAFTVTLPADPEIELVIDYGGFPQEWNIVSNAQGSAEISDSYMNIENDRLSPTPYDVWYQGEYLPAVMDITLPGHMTPILFGAGSTVLLQENEGGTKTWRMESQGYHMIVYAGDYICEEIPIKSAGLTINFYYSRKHQPIMETMDAAEMIRQTVEFCTEHIGPLSSYGDGTFNLIERRSDGSGYAGVGASLANELDYTAQNLSDGVKGASAAQITIHELVHQWWGMDNMFDPEDFDSIWSSEGLACYTTYRIVKELYGESTAQSCYVDVWQQAVDEYYENYYVRHPEYLSALPEQYQADIANSLRSVRQYSEMPLKILRAEQLVGGEDEMDKILSGLFSRELDWEYPYLTYQDFLDACQLTEEELNLD
ncbi:MAG: M1 family metallopeptidase [Clostridiales bacterium]|nr:M1 family metallopeptidase [Clostridiales bacterium]